MRITRSQVKKALAEVLDPEISISVIDLGLIYGIDVKGDKVKITMTLTTIGCPLFSLIEQELKNKLKELGFADDKIEFELTFEPPWSIEKMTPKGKAMLGL